MISKAALLLPLLLTACGAADPVPNETGNSQEVAQPAEKAPAPTAARASAGDKAVGALPPLTPEGWGPLKIGMTLAEITAAAGADAEPDAVGGADPAACDQFRPERAPAGLLVMVEQGRLTRISLIQGSPVRTDRNIGVGDGRDRVEAAYGAAAVASLHKYVEKPAGYLDVWAGGGGGDAFAPAPSARGIRYEIDAANRVSAIHAGGPAIQYVEGCS